MNHQIEIRDSTRQDFIDICGKPPPCRFRGKTVTRNGEPIGIAGLTPSNCSMEAFSSIKPGAVYGRMELLRVSMQIIQWMDEQCPIVYIALEPGVKDKYHEWIGFRFVREWNGRRIYQLCHN